MESLILPRSSGTFESLSLAGRPESIEALRTWLAEAFPANRIASPGSTAEPQTSGICGPPSEMSWKLYGPCSCSRKMSPDSLGVPLAILTEKGWTKPQRSLFGLLDISESFSETWPRSGTVSDGRCWELTIVLRPIGGSGSGFWRTPTAAETHNQSCATQIYLQDQVLGRENRGMWPTPSVGDVTGGHTSRSGDRKDEPLLNRAVKLWPTPHGMCCENPRQAGPSGNELGRAVNRAMWPTPNVPNGGRTTNSTGKHPDGTKQALDLAAVVRGGPSTRQTYPTPKARDCRPACEAERRRHSPDLPTHVSPNGGQLNPAWVEWLMNWVPGWTSLKPIQREVLDAWAVLQRFDAGAQGLPPNILGDDMRGVRSSRGVGSSPQGRKPDEQLPRERADPLSPMPRDATRKPAVGQSENDEELSMVREGVHVQEAEGNNLLAFLREQVVMGASWCDTDPAEVGVIPRVAVGVSKRVDRLRALCNGQVPMTAAVAWLLLMQSACVPEPYAKP